MRSFSVAIAFPKNVCFINLHFTNRGEITNFWYVEKSIVGRTHLMSWEGNWEVRFSPNNQGILGGSFKYFFNVHPYLGKIPNLTSIFFQMGWFNHQLIYNWEASNVVPWSFGQICSEPRQGNNAHPLHTTLFMGCLLGDPWGRKGTGRTWQDESLGEIDLWRIETGMEADKWSPTMGRK